MEKKYEVDIDLANEAKIEMAQILHTNNVHVLNKVGAFASLYEFQFSKFKNPILVLKTEEPGSKQIIAMKFDRVESVCYDMIHHLINDCIVMGATPLAVQDAIICGKMNKKTVTRIVKAISDACKPFGCLLTGGETSEQPGLVNENTYILTSSIVGVVEKENIIDGTKIREGDVVISLESSGLHTNGYTLIRKILKDNPSILDEKIENQNFLDTILIPHRCYYNNIKDLFGQGIIHGLAHVTGGGIKENLNRVLPNRLNAIIDMSRYKIPDIFKIIKKYANVEEEEMIRTFNLGVGMALITSNEEKHIVINHIKKTGINCYEIGRICDGNKQVICRGDIDWK